MLKVLNAHLEEYLGAFLLAVMACISFINVIVRYCTNLSFAYSEELTVNFFVWIVMLGTARAFREGNNFSMNLVYDHLPRPLRLLLSVFSLVCTLVFFSALCWYGTLEVMDEADLSVVSESLAIPVWLYTMATPLVSAVVIIRTLQKFIQDISLRSY